MNLDELERKHKAFMRYDGNDVVSLLIHAGELQTELLAEVKRLRELIMLVADTEDDEGCEGLTVIGKEEWDALWKAVSE